MYGELKQELKVEVGIVDSPHAYIIRDKVSGVATKRRDDTLKYDDFHVEDSRTKYKTKIMPASKNDDDANSARFCSEQRGHNPYRICHAEFEAAKTRSCPHLELSI